MQPELLLSVRIQMESVSKQLKSSTIKVLEEKMKEKAAKKFDKFYFPSI